MVQGAANHSSASFLILNLLTLSQMQQSLVTNICDKVLSQMQQGLVTNLCNKVWLPEEVALWLAPPAERQGLAKKIGDAFISDDSCNSESLGFN